MHPGGTIRMKAAIRLGVVGTLFGLLLILASPGGGGLGPAPKAEAAAGNNFTITVESPGAEQHQFFISMPGACGLDSALLADAGTDTFTCVTPGTWSLTVVPADGFTLSSISNCAVTADLDVPTAGQQSDFSDFSTVPQPSYSFAINDDEDVSCLFTFATGERTLRLAADPPVVNCGGTSEITAIVRDSADQVVNGLTFEFETDVGTLDPASSMDGITTLELMPGDEDATVTVTVDDLTETILIENDCLPLSIFADPPYLPCGGGTTKLKAVLRDGSGNVVNNADLPVERVH